MMNIIKKSVVVLTAAVAIFSVICITSLLSASYGAEVEKIEESDIPPDLEKTIEVEKASEFKFIPLVDITALGTYSDVSGGNAIGGADIHGTVAPVLRLDKQNYITPLYYGSYNRERQIIVEEEGGRVYNEIMDDNGTLEYKHIINENTILKLDGLTRFHFVKESSYDWTDGLYDYRDFGAGGSVEYFFTKTKTLKNSVSAGFEFYDRRYPNYQSLISLATVTAPETDEKDYEGYRPSFRYSYLAERFNCTFLYSPLFKDFSDKKIIDSDGILTKDKREDWFHYSNLNLSYLPEGSRIALGLGLTGILVDSNQNYYDSRGSIPLADDVFTENYYSFKSININPSLTYIYKLDEKKKPATFTLGYAYLARGYDDRKAQTSDGTYTNDAQLDQSHTVSFQATYPLTEHVSATSLVSYAKALSNMKYQTYYRYDYDAVFGGAGIRIKY